MILDPRMTYTYQPGQADNHPYYGWGASGNVCIIDQVPAALGAATLAASQTATSGTPLTLVSASSAAVTVGCNVTNAITGALVTALGLDVSAARTFTGTFTNGSAKIGITGVPPLGIQVSDQVTLTTTGTLPAPFATGVTYYVCQINTSSAMTLASVPGGFPIVATSAGSGTQTVNVVATNGYYGTYYSAALPCQPPIVCGQAGANASPRLWNPSWAISRAVTITGTGNDSTGTYTVAGFDVYGYPMSQTITGANIGTVTTTKAFKYITSVTPGGTIVGTGVTVGTADVFGLPLRADLVAYLTVNWAGVVVAAPVLVGADISPSTPSTGDVRGTITTLGSASNGTNRLLVFWSTMQANIDNSPVGLVGQQQA
jgi:hypothetical protein